MIKKKILNSAIKLVKKHYPSYDEVKIAELKYGLEGLYLSITKFVVIILLAYFIGILKEVLLLTVFFNIIRMPAFGVHASKSWICLLVSTTIFLGVPLLLINIILPFSIKLVICLICILTFWFYAPADTEKRPLVNFKKRKYLKLFSILIAIIFSGSALYFSNNLISSTLIAALLIESIMIMPVTYSLFGQKYDNYKYYHRRG